MNGLKNYDIVRQLYELMQFMVRYSIWEKLFPNVFIFNKRVRQQVFEINPWTIKMYDFFINHQILDEVNRDFCVMDGIIKTNFEVYGVSDLNIIKEERYEE